jgi:glycine/D-amino acid oxidase-like deaminating enzyme/nitrite reductase/ring-hydroxylating ferredoxin subunit
MTSVWTIDADRAVGHPPLHGRITVDAAVVGGGITGLSTALLLREAGLKVAVLEAGRIGRGNTGGSTGNLYATVSSGLAALADKWKSEAVREAVALRSAAIDLIEENIARHSIDCDFARCPLYTVVADDQQQVAWLIDEHAAARAAGLAANLLDAAPELPFAVRRVLRIDGQAQFNPLHYAQGLAAALVRRGAAVYEGSAVTAVDAGQGLLSTDAGEVHAAQIVFASHTPKGFNIVQAEMETYREYGVAGEVGSVACTDGIVWIRDDAQSIRRYRHHGRDYLIAVGEKHKTGHRGLDEGHQQRMQDYLRRRFGEIECSHRWSAQQYVPADGLPYIGRSGHDNVFIATGFSADGLVWGTVAAEIIAGLVQQQTPAGSELLSPRRFTPVKSARLWAAESAEVVRHLVGDRLSASELDSLAQLQPGEGRIVEFEGHKLAVYRAPDGQLSALSPVCPHMKCLVAWNAVEASWDCPCHGSRFRTDGSVIEGPALQPLQARSVLGDAAAGL